MRHKYVIQFCTTYRYSLILEGHIFIYNSHSGTLFQDSSLALVFTLAHSETCLAVLALIPRFEASVGITADFLVQWPESESPPTSGRATLRQVFLWGWLLPLLIATWIAGALKPLLFSISKCSLRSTRCRIPYHVRVPVFEFEVGFGLKVPGVSSLHHVEEDHLVLSHAQQHKSNKSLFTPY